MIASMSDGQKIQMAQPDSHYATGLRWHSFAALEPGCRLMVLGAVHGNETCGTAGIRRVLQELDDGGLRLLRGTLTLLPVANPMAYRHGRREGERNLNRSFEPTATPRDHEDRLTNILAPLFAQHDALLDLHSFTSHGDPIAMVGPRDNQGLLEPFAHEAKELSLALSLGPRRLVEGWMEIYAKGIEQRKRFRAANGLPPQDEPMNYGRGTNEYMRSQGGYGITLECGQHLDPQAPEVAYRAIRNALAHLCMTVDAPPAPHKEVEMVRLSEVFERHHEEDRFVRDWATFDRVARGEAIATRRDGTPVPAPADGVIIFPHAQAPVGREWFYTAVPSDRVR
jgi:uncharacterized protein